MLRVCGLLAASVMASRASVVYIEDFEGGANGWGDRDSGEMGVTYQSSVGSPASGAMQGAYNSQGFPIPQTDAFSITSGANFVGDYTSYGNGLTQISFDLYAEDIIPSDVFIRLVDGSNVFTYQLSLALMGVDTWTTFTVNLGWAYGWNGASEAAFNSALTSVDALEIELTRSGSGSQLYYLDNIQTLDDDLPPPSSSAVPEPGEGLLFFGVMVMLGIKRRQMVRAK